MTDTLLCDTHRPHHLLLEDLRSTHTGDFIYHHFPLAIVQTESWTRLVLLNLYTEGRYPADYYSSSPKLIHLS